MLGRYFLVPYHATSYALYWREAHETEEQATIAGFVCTLNECVEENANNILTLLNIAMELSEEWGKLRVKMTEEEFYAENRRVSVLERFCGVERGNGELCILNKGHKGEHSSSHIAVFSASYAKQAQENFNQPQAKQNNQTLGVTAESYAEQSKHPHEYEKTDPYSGCAKCGFGPGTIFHNIFEVAKHNRANKIYFQPKLSPREWEQTTSIHSWEVYLLQQSCKKDFPDHDVVKYTGDDIGNRVYRDAKDMGDTNDG